MTSYKIAASLAYLLLVSAVGLRKKIKFHIPLALLAVAFDFVLVLLLEFNRDVIGLLSTKDYTPLQYGHVLSSSLAFFLYFPTVYFGFKLLKNRSDRPLKKRHLKFAVLAFILRTLGFLMMFSI